MTPQDRPGACPMSHLTLSMNDQGRYLSAVASGVWDSDEVSEAIDRIAARAHELGHARVLFDLTPIKSAPRWHHERSRLGRQAANALTGMYVAVVVPADRMTRIAELSANNRGTLLRVWPDREAAEEWLVSDVPPMGR